MTRNGAQGPPGAVSRHLQRTAAVTTMGDEADKRWTGGLSRPRLGLDEP